jgi:hypothetical protein
MGARVVMLDAPARVCGTVEDRREGLWESSIRPGRLLLVVSKNMGRMGMIGRLRVCFWIVR